MSRDGHGHIETLRQAMILSFILISTTVPYETTRALLQLVMNLALDNLGSVDVVRIVLVAD